MRCLDTIIARGALAVLLLASFTMGFSPSRCLVSLRPNPSVLMFAKSKDDSGNSNETDVVTKEMFLRDLLRDPSDEEDEDEEGDISSKDVTVKRKNKKGRSGNHKPYKVLDNRDTLPFAVEVATPDPYTHPEVKKQKALKNSVTPKKRHDSIESSVSSSLFVQSYSGSSKKGAKGSDVTSSSADNARTWLGDFQLDKLTTTGDVLEIGDRQFKVVKHKCQYKYAGGKRFVMTRKILEVKEVGRLKTEEYLKAQFTSETNSDGSIDSL